MLTEKQKYILLATIIEEEVNCESIKVCANDNNGYRFIILDGGNQYYIENKSELRKLENILTDESICGIDRCWNEIELDIPPFAIRYYLNQFQDTYEEIFKIKEESAVKLALYIKKDFIRSEIERCIDLNLVPTPGSIVKYGLIRNIEKGVMSELDMIEEE